MRNIPGLGVAGMLLPLLVFLRKNLGYADNIAGIYIGIQ